MVVDGWGHDQGPVGGLKKTGRNPTDRGKQGTQRSLLTEASGLPLSVIIEGANRHDMQLARMTLEGLVVPRPEPTPERPQHLCLDKGYDYDEIRALAKEFQYTAHIRAWGEEAQAIKREAGFKARRWVVDITQPHCPHRSIKFRLSYH